MDARPLRLGLELPDLESAEDYELWSTAAFEAVLSIQEWRLDGAMHLLARYFQRHPEAGPVEVDLASGEPRPRPTILGAGGEVADAERVVWALEDRASGIHDPMDSLDVPEGFFEREPKRARFLLDALKLELAAPMLAWTMSSCPPTRNASIPRADAAAIAHALGYHESAQRIESAALEAHAKAAPAKRKTAL